MRRLLPHFASISQFEPGLPTGMCGLIATLGALQYRLGAAWPLNAAGIAKLFEFERARGLCATNGAQNIYHVRDAFRALVPALAAGVELTGYESFNLATFHNTIHAYAGIHGIVVEYANGQALTGDEVGLHYHFNAIGGIADDFFDEGYIGGYATCDGDARTDLPGNIPTPPIWHPFPTLARAIPIGYVVLHD